MSALGGKGPLGMGLMWFFTAFSFIFVLLRLYTRIFLVHNIGPDDYLYSLSWVLLLLYTIFMTVSAMYGFGRHITELTMDEAVNAVFWEMVSQTFAVLGMAIAKVSLSVFLLRIVTSFWQKVFLWVAIVSIMFISVLTDIVFWVQCLPSAAIYDPRVKGACHLQVEPVAIALGSWCIVEDFFLALYPWYFIWGLQMNRKEKLTIACGLSLGIFAGICGIFRTQTLTGFNTTDYPYSTFGLIVWSAGEVAITLVCIAVPVLRPLYKKVLNKGSSMDYMKSYQKATGNTTDGEQNLGYKMTDFPRHHGKRDYVTNEVGVQANGARYQNDNSSEERILGPEFKANGIRTTKEVTVTSYMA